jgi:hypothetical protein
MLVLTGEPYSDTPSFEFQTTNLEANVVGNTEISTIFPLATTFPKKSPGQIQNAPSLKHLMLPSELTVTLEKLSQISKIAEALFGNASNSISIVFPESGAIKAGIVLPALKLMNLLPSILIPLVLSHKSQPPV